MIELNSDVRILNFEFCCDTWIQDLPNYRTREISSPYIRVKVDVPNKNEKIVSLESVLLYNFTEYLAGFCDTDEIIRESQFGKMSIGDYLNLYGIVYIDGGTDYPFNTYSHRLASEEEIKTGGDKLFDLRISQKDLRDITHLLVPWGCASLKK